MQRTRRTSLNDEATPEPADPKSAGSASSPATSTSGDAPATSSSVGEEGSDSTPALSGAEVAGGDEAVRSRKWIVLFAVAGILVLGLDQLTKALALAHLTPGEPVDVIGSLLRFNLIRNSGAAFSLGAGYTPVISAIQIVIAIGVVYLSRRLGSVGWAVAFGLLFGGAVGNITDRIFRAPSPFHGHVVDFLQTPHWAIFNVADMAVTSAAILLVIQTLRGIRLDGTKEQRK
ncbi:signal peptidase II [Kribbella sp. NPDC056951]|uniref:signal peptidase II n=1 Tax=Kribbella sp. NPDC056951 TaxID=3345978 RepID=UPI0036266D38